VVAAPARRAAREVLDGDGSVPSVPVFICLFPTSHVLEGSRSTGYRRGP
jgi:hypothetical protein